MSAISIGLSPELQVYMLQHSTLISPIALELIEETRALGDRASMQIAPEQAIFMGLITRLSGARRAVEVGTFTGLSAMAVAASLPDDGRLLCCDISEEWTSIARRYWARAGVDGKIELRLAPAIDTLRSLPNDPSVDLAFIDADKEGYVGYYEELIPRLTEGGILLADNVLWSGRVTNDDPSDQNLGAIQQFNDHVAADPRVEVVMLPIGDGLTLARKL